MGATDIDIAAHWPPFVGAYRIRGEIASGGMASVYLGVRENDSSSGARRPAITPPEPIVRAVKRVHPHLARQREFVEMFVDEARIASRIRHPNVCGVFEWGESDGTYFLAMELLAGEPLVVLLRALSKRSEVLADPRWHRAVARIVADACAGLHAAHDAIDDDGEPMHVVHRDVSPHNLFVTWDGVAKVVDFGVASAKRRLHHTTTGTVKGKFAYMAPEQLQGAPVDRRADVWSLGVVLWELLAGRPLFRRTVETETIFAVLNETIPPFERVSPHAPTALEQIARRALTGDLERRTPSADRMRAELETWLDAEGGCATADVAVLLDELLPGKRALADERMQSALAGARAITPSASPEPTPATGAKVSGVQRRIDGRVRAASIASIAIPLAALAAITWIVVAGDDLDHAEAPVPTIGSVTVPAPAPPLAPASPPPPNAPREPRARATVPEPTAETQLATPPAIATASRPRRAAPRESVVDDDAGEGELDVATPGGWAEVWMDGARLGHTPGRFRLPAGRHTLVIRAGDGGEEQRASVRIVGGQLARLRVDLQR